MKSLIDKEKKKDKLFNKYENELLESFLSFDLTKDLKILDKLILQEYTNNTFYGDLNKWLMSTNFNSYEVVAYYMARLKFSLNKYANKEGNYYSLDQHNLYRGMKISYSSILPYERVKGKILLLSSFISTNLKIQKFLKIIQEEKMPNLYIILKKIFCYFYY